MKIALLSNVTIEVLAGMLRREHALWVQPGFDTWRQVALEPPADLVRFDPDVIAVLLDGRFCAVDATVLESARGALAVAFPKASVLVPDLARLSGDFGAAFYDERMWRLGAMPWSLTGLRTLARLFGVKKVVAVDLDGTLWDGVLAEDGVDGVCPRLEFQRQLKELKERGVLLVALSKNNAEDVEAIWSDSRMVLRKGDFIAVVASWEPKADNLAKVARELNVGEDAFVFVDDNPAERAEMRAKRPMVAVSDFPPQLAVWFPPRTVTHEDVRKTELYRAEAERKRFGEGKSVGDYLSGLGLWAEMRPLAESDVARVAQLSQKSNQFNPTTHRYTEVEIGSFVGLGDRVFLTVRAGDRFGEQGLVGYVQARISGAGAEIVDFVLSCRVMGRTLEIALEERIERELLARGVVEVRARYEPTAKNAPVADLFPRLGYREVSAGIYLKRLPGAEALTHHYEVKGGRMQAFLDRMAACLEVPGASEAYEFRTGANWSSLQAFSILVVLETEFGRRMSIDEFQTMTTLGDLARACGIAG